MINGYFVEKELQQRTAALERRLARMPAPLTHDVTVRERIAAGLVSLACRVDPAHVGHGASETRSYWLAA